MSADRIVRVWKGYGSAAGVRRYCDEHFGPTLLPQLRGLAGFVSATVLTRPGEHETQVVVATVWDSLQAVKGFAGDDYRRAVVEPIVTELLDRFDDHATHYTVALTT